MRALAETLEKLRCLEKGTAKAAKSPLLAGVSVAFSGEHRASGPLGDISEAWRETWEERAGIREHEGGMSRAEAERAATFDVEAMIAAGWLSAREPDGPAQ